ncbi:hypothetical protein CcCBS67573_g09198 [Chytriomyces confervae]|uniref:ABC transporter domain-containing protein n=1 Tax=Chytriomyces confervae TaxID=246404 RepID=A0A507E2C9_9FUNG|nr:hypothetical protein CcCBS67573_g09198 [Chytriomyces confervae]
MGGGRVVPEPPAGSENDPTLNFTLGTANLPSGAGKSCYIAPNLAIGIGLDPKQVLTCDPGWYCPNLNQSDPTTLPVYCPPSSGCQQYRLTSLPCSPQGKYEPVVCKPGFYCPDFLTMLPCPKGYYCPTGTVTPHACTWFASCPQGSYSQTVYGFFIFMGLLDFLLAVMIIIFKFRQGHIKIGLFGGQKDGNGGQDLISTILQGPSFALEQTARRTIAQVEAARHDTGMHPGGEVMSPEESSNQGMQLLVDAFRESFRNRELRMNFRFDNLALVLKNGKTILQGVTGEIRSKRMTAIIGPSGAGKTTFMNVLMGKVSRTGGELFINGEKTEMHLYKKIVGYVPQEDIMINHLTVRENVLHAARVRLPRHWTAKQINNHVDNILRALNLAHVANSCIGDENTRGISGGQRKRVNIAMELAAAPLAIFLDEPTSGLDATSSLDVANILHSVASLGLTIVAVIHQPRIEIFRKFDDVLMIAPGGRVAYLGPTTLAKQYFETLGFEFEPMANASDTLMDILAGKGVNRLFTLTPDQLVEIWEDRHSRDIYNEPPSFFNQAPEENPQEVVEDLVSRPASVVKVEQWLGAVHSSDHKMMSSSPPRDDPVPVRSVADEDDDIPISLSMDRGMSRRSRNSRSGFVVADEVVSEGRLRHTSDVATAVHTPVGSARNLHLSERDVGAAVAAATRPAGTPRTLTRSLKSRKSFQGARGSEMSEDGRNFEREFHVVVPQVVKERGASFIKQVYYCHQRSLIQQSRQVGALALEIFVAMFAGMLMGVSTIGKVKELMNGIYWGIYILLSPAPLDLLALYGLLIGIAIALSGAPAGVKVFGEEKPVFWREAASGHSRLAYYLGKTIATVYRLILTSLHFTGLYMLLAKPVLDPYMQYALVLFQFWGVYGISCIVSVVVRRENASLLAVVIALFAAIFCGYGPSLVQAKKSGYMFLFEMSFNKWAAEANYAASIIVYRNRLDIDLMASIWGYSLSQVNLDLFMCVIIGIVMRVIGFVLMISLNRDKQR